MASEDTKITSGSLIAAEKVEGTDVYNLQGDKLGTVDDIMLDKVSGKAIYAIMSFGGFLGIGEKYHPLPWSMLRYDGEKNGYVVPLEKKKQYEVPGLAGQRGYTSFGKEHAKGSDAPDLKEFYQHGQMVEDGELDFRR